MTLYTIMPYEDIFPGEGNIQQIPQIAEVTINGILMEVELLSEHQARIHRLLTCNLEDYLNPAYMPGSLVSFVPVILQN
ncbi:YlzJ-like family protein [Paenibacillus lemnae]|uniref:Uncharacterized protein n=1 Tax=Paenibacillus lemnae TaxID=1330551 RepID=A0A848M7H7_PAELE|nr:YlzJ-like family protein [Paenibacillus lemnae]NMO96219.1 hypothetical protein [Paenibacillus lemnae]